MTASDQPSFNFGDPDCAPTVVPEPYLTYRQAATALNIPYFKIQRAAKIGLIPIYTLLNSRSYVKASEIKKLMRSN